MQVPKGNATNYCFECWIIDGKFKHSERKLMSASKVIEDVQIAAQALMAGRTVYLEAVGHNLDEVEKLIKEHAE